MNDQPPDSPEAREAAKLRQAINDLNLNQSSFSMLMSALGDKREMKTILRSIQRMAGEDARLSGEMHVILTLLEREQMRAKRLVAATQWRERDGGGLTAEVQNVRLTITPQSKGRWQVHARYIGDGPNGYDPAIPHWRSSLEEAKLRAVLAVDETLDHVEKLKAGVF